MGGVFFRRRRAAPVEILNDLSGDVVNLFRIVRHHPAALLTEQRLQIHARSELRRLVALDPAALTDVQRAARFLGILRMGYAGRPESRSFSGSPHSGRAQARARLRAAIRAAHRRLERVAIEQLPFDQFIARYDSDATLFYLDPPYWGSEDDYGRGMFARADFARLANQLGGIKGRFVLSLNDRPELRNIFGAFAIQDIATTYMAAGHGTAARELIVTDGRPIPQTGQIPLL